MAARGPQKVFGRVRQFSLNKFFDPSNPSMRKGCDGEEEEVEKKRIVKNLTNISPTDQIKAPFQSFKFWEKKKSGPPSHISKQSTL